MHFEAQTADLKMHAGKDFLLSSGAGMTMDVHEGDARFRVLHGGMNLQAACAITFGGEGGGPIRLGQSGGKIEITANGNLAIDAPEVKITGGSIAIKGLGTGNNS